MIITDLLIKSFDDILDVEYTRSIEEDLDRIEQGEADYKGTLHDLLQEVQEGSRQGRQGDAEPQGRHQDRGDLRPVRQGHGDQGRQVRPVRGVQRLSGLHEHRENWRRANRAARRATSRRKSPATTAASRWWSSADASGSSSPAPVIRSARPRGRSFHAGGMKAAKPDQISRREVPEVRVEPRDQAGPLRRVHGLHELSQLQVREA